MMECKIDEKNISFGSNAFCDVCGMDLGINAVRKKHRSTILWYCCKNCASL